MGDSFSSVEGLVAGGGEAVQAAAFPLMAVLVFGTVENSFGQPTPLASEAELLAVLTGDSPKAEKAMIARVASRPAEGGSTFSTGADVSRFQRSTVPGKARDESMLPGAAAAPAAGGAYPGAAAAGDGPVVKVSRGNAVTVVPVGGKN